MCLSQSDNCSALRIECYVAHILYSKLFCWKVTHFCTFILQKEKQVYGNTSTTLLLFQKVCTVMCSDAISACVTIISNPVWLETNNFSRSNFWVAVFLVFQADFSEVAWSKECKTAQSKIFSQKNCQMKIKLDQAPKNVILFLVPLTTRCWHT